MKSTKAACRTKTKPKESDTQKAIIDYLEANKIYHKRFNLGGVPHTVGGKTIYRKNPLKGFPDIVAWYGSITIGSEVKAKTKQSREQLECQKDFEREGLVYLIARSVEDVKYALECLKPEGCVVLEDDFAGVG